MRYAHKQNRPSQATHVHLIAHQLYGNLVPCIFGCRHSTPPYARKRLVRVFESVATNAPLVLVAAAFPALQDGQDTGLASAATRKGLIQSAEQVVLLLSAIVVLEAAVDAARLLFITRFPVCHSLMYTTQ
eukprot:scaffold3289_cov362-Prasinococcus_capsulatus_cf.AAC.5